MVAKNSHAFLSLSQYTIKSFIGAGGCCDFSVIKRICCVWGKFHELLPILTSCSLSYITSGQIYSIYICTVLLYASGYWAPNVNDLLKLQRNDRAMIRSICNVRLQDRYSSDSLVKKKLAFNALVWSCLKKRQLISNISGCKVAGQCGHGRPRKTWKDTITDELRCWKLTIVNH